MNMDDNAVQTGDLTPGEIARRALRTLAERRLVPTPDRFAEVYFEIAGAREGADGATAVLHEMLRDLARSNRMSAQEAAHIQERVAAHDWLAVRAALDCVLSRRVGALAGNWPQLALVLLRQTDAVHTNWTRARKLEAVGRVLEVAHGEPDTAFERLHRLLESWGPAVAALPRGEAAPATAEPATAVAAPAVPLPESASQGFDPAEPQRSGPAQAEAAAWKQIALRAIGLLRQQCGEGSAAAHRLVEYGARHAGRTPPEEVGQLFPRFVEAAAGIERETVDHQQVRAGLRRLLLLLCDSVKHLPPEEDWLGGQLEPIRSLLGGPIGVEQIAAAEERMARAIQRQAGARRGLQEARSALKEVLATLIERVGAMGSNTSRFYDQVGVHQTELAKVSDIHTLSQVLKALLADTKAMHADIGKNRDELLEARRQVDSYEQRVRELERELTQVSSMVQKDPLTHALNRRGLADVFRIEAARAARYGTELSMALLDLDDFKLINDDLGHLAGDRALVHLLTVMRASLRPTDAVARIGGEEFAVLLSTTGLDAAVAVTERLQAEVARCAFLHDGKPNHLTFSAGAALWKPGETLESILQRADAAMYRAKRAGKNRVLRAD